MSLPPILEKGWHLGYLSVFWTGILIMWMKFAKYWDDIHLLLAISVVLDPRYKLHIIEYYATKFGSTDTHIIGENIKLLVCDLVLEYQRKSERNSNITSGSGVAVTTKSAMDLDFDLYVSQRKKSRTTLVTTELDHYLAEELIPRSSYFDLLMWWKLNGAKYPTLQEIARDLLSIPITSVASESAFSSSGRLLDPQRSKLHFSMVEAMMCTRSWIKDDTNRDKDIKMEELEGVFNALIIEDTSVEDIEEHKQSDEDKVESYNLDD
ncbi:Zinc finger BED domain-containing protein RICESLEEPER 3 [Linum perenne]